MAGPGTFGMVRRRQVTWLLSAWAATWSGVPGARETDARTDTAARDRALRAMRATDLSPAWFTSANWDNASYRPWTDYLAGRIDDAAFLQVCANPSDYCLRDVWNLRRAEPARIDWTASTPFNWNGIHALALRFYRTGDDVYLRKWLGIVSDFAQWSRTESARPDTPLKRGTAAALLDTAFAWGGIFTAFAIIAKGLRPAATTASPYPAAEAELAAAELDRVPAESLAGIFRAFAEGPAPDLARHYASPSYVPNQRAFGLEALAFAAAIVPSAGADRTWQATLHAGLGDVATRYRQADGGQLEQSFNYAQDVIGALQRAANLPFADTPSWRAEAQRSVSGWWRMAAALSTPTGGLPQLGNAAWGRYGRAAPPVPLEGTSFAFPYSGLYAMRSSWSDDAAFLFFFVRRQARGHAMAGTNSIQIAAYGRHLIGAGGSAVYGGPGRSRPLAMAHLAETSSFKTSTVLVDGRSQAAGSMDGLATDADGKPDVTRAPTRPIASRWHAADEFDVVEGEHRQGYTGTLEDESASLISDVVHQRRVVFVRPLKLWVVLDLMRSSSAHDYTQVWKFSPPSNGLAVPGFDEVQVALRPDGRLIETIDDRPQAVNVRLQHFGIGSLSYQRYFGSGAFGWFAAGPASAPVPAVDVHAQWRGTGPQVLLTVIAPFRGRASPFARVEDLSGGGSAGCRLDMADGSRLSVVAAADPRPLAAAGRSEETEFLLVLEPRGGVARGVALSAASAFRFEGKSRFPIVVPEGFRWVQSPGGRLAAAYDRTA